MPRLTLSTQNLSRLLCHSHVSLLTACVHKARYKAVSVKLVLAGLNATTCFLSAGKAVIGGCPDGKEMET